MRIHLHIIVTTLSLILITSAVNGKERKFDAGRYENPYFKYPDYFNDNLNYNKNYRDFYKTRPYYDNLFKHYNPNKIEAQARIVANDLRTPKDGFYSYAYATDSGISVEERGIAVPAGSNGHKEIVQGSYSFITPEGVPIHVRYVADEHGFHPIVTYGRKEPRRSLFDH